MATIEEQLARLARFKEDWNSYGAKAITPAAIAKAREMFDNLGIGGAPNGGIEIEWELGGLCIIIVIGPDGKVEIGG